MSGKHPKTGDLVQASECKQNDVTYGVICILMKHAFPRLKDAELALHRFMQHLQPMFAIQHTTGIDVRYSSQQNKMSITDYWQDAERQDWKVRGWTNGCTVTVLYIKNIGSTAVEKEERFLNGSLFQGT